MANLIDKSALVAEIERKADIICQGVLSEEATISVEYFKDSLISFLDTLEEKEVQEEPVSEVWHDSNKEQPKSGSNVAVWDGNSGEILTQCVSVYPDRKLAYMDDLLYKQEEPVSEDLEEAASEYAIIFRPEKGEPIINEPTKESFIAGAQWQKERIISKACEWLKENATYVHPRKGVETCMVNLTVFKEAIEE